MAGIPSSSGSEQRGFSQVVDGFLAQPGLPFAQILSAERIGRIFAKHGNLFGGQQIYSTATVLWAFLGQVLACGKGASCQAAVAAIITYRQMIGQSAPTADTGDYCRARAKLSEAGLRELTVEIAAELEDRADPKWLWKGMHAKLIDGFTFTLPDAEANQAAFPMPPSQTKGVGMPIARATVILSLATACVMDLALGPYSGKQTGETALLRQILDSLKEGEIAVMDRYDGSFLMIALLGTRGVHVCARVHHRRHVDFRRGRRLGKYDHLIHWTKPARPDWMDEQTYAAIPDTLELREIRYTIVEKGRRSRSITVVTTLTDADLHPQEEIAQLYGFRWNAELDIRSIKQSLHLSHARCQSPDMVRKELWTTLLGYNLIRTTAAAAALLHEQQPRQISFTATCQLVLSSWMLFACRSIGAERIVVHCRAILSRIAGCKVADRPGRLEPRVLKRRRHGYKLMQEPRSVLRDRLVNPNSCESHDFQT